MSSDKEVHFRLKATDEASGSMQAVISVMKKGTLASDEEIASFKQQSAQTRLQTRAMNEFAGQLRATQSSMTMFGRAMSSVGAIGSTVMGMTNTMILSNINLGISGNNLATAQENVTVATQAYYAAVKEYGPTDARTLQAKQNLIAAENQLKNAQASNRLVTIQTAMAYTGVALSVGSLISNFISARVNTLAYMAAQQVETGVTDEAATSTTLLGLAMDALPIIAIMAVIIALVAILYKATDGFTKWGAVIGAFKDVGNVLKGALSGLGGIVEAAGTDVLKALTDLWTKVFSQAQAAWKVLTGGWKLFWKDFVDVVSGIGAAVGAAVKFVINGVIGIINDFIKYIDGILGFINTALSIIHAPSIPTIPQIATLATGGIVSSPTLAMIGEAGPEAVVPLSGANAPAGVGGGVTVNVYVSGSVMTENDLMNTIDRGLWKLYGLRRRSS